METHVLGRMGIQVTVPGFGGVEISWEKHSFQGFGRAGNGEPPACTSLRATLGETLATLTSWARAKGLDLVCYLYLDLSDLPASTVAPLRQVLLHLVGNAIKITERGRVVVRVQTLGREEWSSLNQSTWTDSGDSQGTPSLHPRATASLVRQGESLSA
jgi:hypothetical protein